MQAAMRLWSQGGRQEKGTNQIHMKCNIQRTCNSASYQLLSPTCPAGGWETAVLALYPFLPPCPAEDQGAKEGLRLLQLFLPERERPPLQTASPPPPPPTQTQQFSPQVCSPLCHFSISHLCPQTAQPDCWFQHKTVKDFVSVCGYLPSLPIFHRLSGSLSPEQEQGLWKPRWNVSSYLTHIRYPRKLHWRCF